MDIQRMLTPLFRQIVDLTRDVERLKTREGAPRSAPYPSTIVNDEITWMRSYHVLTAETGIGTGDNLATISGGKDGARITLRIAPGGGAINIQDAVGNLALAGNCPLATERDTISLIYDESLALWLETGRSLNG